MCIRQYFYRIIYIYKKKKHKWEKTKKRKIFHSSSIVFHPCVHHHSYIIVLCASAEERKCERNAMTDTNKRFSYRAQAPFTCTNVLSSVFFFWLIYLPDGYIARKLPGFYDFPLWCAPSPLRTSFSFRIIYVSREEKLFYVGSAFRGARLHWPLRLCYLYLYLYIGRKPVVTFNCFGESCSRERLNFIYAYSYLCTGAAGVSWLIP